MVEGWLVVTIVRYLVRMCQDWLIQTISRWMITGISTRDWNLDLTVEELKLVT